MRSKDLLGEEAHKPTTLLRSVELVLILGIIGNSAPIGDSPLEARRVKIRRILGVSRVDSLMVA